MATVESYAIPRYTRDHFTYFNQIFEWYLDINHYKDQLLVFNVDRSRHFHQWLKERGSPADITSLEERIEEY